MPELRGTRYAGEQADRPGILAELFFSMARAQPVDSAVSDEKGPFPGRKFGIFRTPALAIRNGHEIRTIQDEMSNHDGRDNLLNQHSWTKFEGDVAFAMKALKIEDNAAAKLMFQEGLRTILSTRSTLKDRLEHLEELREGVDAKLKGPQFVRFVEALDGVVKKNRELDDPANANPHDPKFALWALAVRNLIRLGKGAVGRAGMLPVTAVLSLISIVGNGCEYLDWAADVNDYEWSREPYLELIELSSSLALLIEQYNPGRGSGAAAEQAER
jgi:hypothetical protein